MQREKIQLIRDGLETAYVNGNTASELLYKPNFVSNNHNEGKKVLSVIEDELTNSKSVLRLLRWEG